MKTQTNTVMPDTIRKITQEITLRFNPSNQTTIMRGVLEAVRENKLAYIKEATQKSTDFIKGGGKPEDNTWEIEKEFTTSSLLTFDMMMKKASERHNPDDREKWLEDLGK